MLQNPLPVATGMLLIFSRVMKSYLSGVTDFIESLSIDEISEARQLMLIPIADYISAKSSNKLDVNLLWICTHNSRRSQFAQFWSKVLADYYGVRLNSISGGMEITEVNPNIISQLEQLGLSVISEEKENPAHSVFYALETDPVVLQSKHFEDSHPNIYEFAALFVCSDAEESCPYVSGAEKRFYIPFKDPKKSDGTGKEDKVYGKSMRQIATELKFVFERCGDL